MESHERRNPSQPALIANALGEDFALAKVIEDSPELSQGGERIAKVEPEVDSLLDGLATLGEMREGGDRPLEACDGFPVGIESFDRLHGPSMKGPPAVVEDARVANLVA